MLATVLHRWVSHPRVYECVQAALGAGKLERRLVQAIGALPPPRVVVDIGGGTGRHQRYFSTDALYVCMDNDPVKLLGVDRRTGVGVVLGDAARLPLCNGCADLVLCNAVSHHLPDGVFEEVLREAARLLSPEGRFVFLDAVWAPRRTPGRILWHYDRGSFPRPPDVLRRALNYSFCVVQWEQLAIWHEYVLCVARRQ